MLNEKSKILIFIFVTLFLLAAYQYFVRLQILREGVYSKCIVTDVHGYKGGISVTLKYTFHDSIYQSTMSRSIKMNQIGKQYFIKLKPKNPNEIIFLDQQPVPDCLINLEPPKSGWKEIPICK